MARLWRLTDDDATDVTPSPGPDQSCGSRGGVAGPNPTDRRQPATKCHLVVDVRSTPLGVLIGTANQHDTRCSP